MYIEWVEVKGTLHQNDMDDMNTIRPKVLGMCHPIQLKTPPVFF